MGRPELTKLHGWDWSQQSWYLIFTAWFNVYFLLIWHSCRTSPSMIGKSTINGPFPASYVSLPEGDSGWSWLSQLLCITWRWIPRRSNMAVFFFRFSGQRGGSNHMGHILQRWYIMVNFWKESHEADRDWNQLNYEMPWISGGFWWIQVQVCLSSPEQTLTRIKGSVPTRSNISGQWIAIIEWENPWCEGSNLELASFSALLVSLGHVYPC